MTDTLAPQQTTRIEYIDALRGFTMLLVVMNHVAAWGLNCDGYSSIFSTFRMPLFFFVSGFVFYSAKRIWDNATIITFLKKKIVVQLFTPLLFFIAFISVQHYNLIDGFLSESKMGYWFTLTLFEFFVIYIVLQLIFKWLHIKDILQDCIYIIVGLALYVLMHHKVIGESMAVRLLGCVTWRHFIYFIIGTMAKKYFQYIERLLDKSPLVLICLFIFVFFSIFPLLKSISPYVQSFVLALAGIVITFAGFRKYQETFNSTHKLGRVMQFVGRRTLDIYLLHYFFITDSIATIFKDIPFAEAPFMGFVGSLIVSILVIAACLFVSQILRISPFVSQHLFGTKKKQ